MNEKKRIECYQRLKFFFLFLSIQGFWRITLSGFKVLQICLYEWDLNLLKFVIHHSWSLIWKEFSKTNLTEEVWQKKSFCRSYKKSFFFLLKWFVGNSNNDKRPNKIPMKKHKCHIQEPLDSPTCSYGDEERSYCTYMPTVYLNKKKIFLNESFPIFPLTFFCVWVVPTFGIIEIVGKDIKLIFCHACKFWHWKRLHKFFFVL